MSKEKRCGDFKVLRFSTPAQDRSSLCSLIYAVIQDALVNMGTNYLTGHQPSIQKIGRIRSQLAQVTESVLKRNWTVRYSFGED